MEEVDVCFPLFEGGLFTDDFRNFVKLYKYQKKEPQNLFFFTFF